jgi:hypothetical protein
VLLRMVLVLPASLVRFHLVLDSLHTCSLDLLAPGTQVLLLLLLPLLVGLTPT